MSVFKSKRIDLKLLKVNLQGFSRFCLQRGMTDLEQQLTFKSHLFFHSLHLFSFLSPAHHHLYNIFGNMPLGNRNLASPTLPSYSLLAHQRDFLALFPPMASVYTCTAVMCTRHNRKICFENSVKKNRQIKRSFNVN